MTPAELDQLRALAQSATPGPWRVEAQGHAEQEVARVNNLEAAARYLRDCAEAEPVATVRVHDTGGNAGIAWTGVPTEDAGVMRGGTPLYTHPQPPSAQAEVVEELAALARFGAACLIASREDLCDLDAGWLQDVAEATGCLEREERAEPCGADCRCADEGDSFPTQCLRAPDRLWRLAAALDAIKETSR